MNNSEYRKKFTMNEELLVAAIFERAITDYEKARRFLRHPHGNKKQMEKDIAKAKHRIKDVRSFATSKEAMMYAGGSEKVVRCFAERLDKIDRENAFR